MTLANGDRLPELAVKNLDGEDVAIAALVGDGWAVVLFYRGHW